MCFFRYGRCASSAGKDFACCGTDCCGPSGKASVDAVPLMRAFALVCHANGLCPDSNFMRFREEWFGLFWSFRRSCKKSWFISKGIQKSIMHRERTYKSKRLIFFSVWLGCLSCSAWLSIETETKGWSTRKLEFTFLEGMERLLTGSSSLSKGTSTRKLEFTFLEGMERLLTGSSSLSQPYVGRHREAQRCFDNLTNQQKAV